jgi:calcium-dependent protein kinase
MGCVSCSSTTVQADVYAIKKLNSSRALAVEGPKIHSGLFVHSNSGSVWENYTRVRLLGKGANGCVYEAVNQLTSDRRAIKVISKRKIKSVNLEKFMEEVNILRQLDHPNIVKLYEFFEDSRDFYLVTEYLTGGELFDYLTKKGCLNETEAATIMEQLLGVVNYCHTSKIVHRDLKPENLLRDNPEEDSPIKVIDFGASTLISSGQRLNTVQGSAYYIAPEVLDCNYTEKCDLWSCGVILYLMLSGNPPFPGRSQSEILSKVMTGVYSLGDRAWRKVSKEAKDLIQRMIVVDPDSRISAQDALRHPWFRMWRASTPDEMPSVLDSMGHLKAFTASSKLKQAVHVFIAAQLISKEERDQLTLAFKALDTNNDGRLSREELMEGLRASLPEAEVASKVSCILKNCDADMSGFIDYTEFLSASLTMDSSHNTAALKACFSMFDTDHSGTISLAELRGMLDPELLQSDLAWQGLLREADANGDGEIDLSEFQQLVLRL